MGRKKLKVIAIVQARTGSSRLPGKVLKPLAGKTLIGVLLQRLSWTRKVDEIILATSDLKRDDRLSSYVQQLGYRVFRGSEGDVLERYYFAAQQAYADVVVRITGDCPLIDPELVDQVITHYFEGDVEYASNVDPPTFPDGLDVEVFSFQSLQNAWELAQTPFEREHVTPCIRKNLDAELKTNLVNDFDASGARWTVDEEGDYQLVQKIIAHFAPRLDFSWREVWRLWQEGFFQSAENLTVTRNEGAHMSSGQKLWRRAKQIIPGGNMLLSKRTEMFLPEQWPAYFSQAAGCEVWDLDGQRYIDMSIMGVGTNILGYGHPEVDDGVRQVIDQGNMSTLNCPEEVYLAEKLIELHPWAEMVRFARTGGEANAVAVRIARAAAGRDNIAICGYHGWHDWYLAANLGGTQSLAGHLLPGLDPNGVPNHLKDTIFPFSYNRFDELEHLIAHKNIGIIKMEVSRNEGPDNDFLKKVRNIARKHGIVLIFDECTSGFRQTFGGLHKLYGVEPDMAVFGKALGNGYAITAVIGRRQIMEAAQTSFISSTFWTERIGPTAALKTLQVMEHLRSWEIITEVGTKIREGWQRLAIKHGLTVDLWGIPALSGFTIKSEQSLAYKTLISQEMLVKGYLASNAVYTCIEHKPSVIEGYFAALDPVFGLIAQCEEGRDVGSLLRGPVCHAGFKRLN